MFERFDAGAIDRVFRSNPTKFSDRRLGRIAVKIQSNGPQKAMPRTGANLIRGMQ
jgi:hypothetical protein